jgi:hypothetical protein
MEGLGSVPALGAVLAGQGTQLPFFAVNSDGEELREVSAYLRDLILRCCQDETRDSAAVVIGWYSPSGR